MAQSSSIGFALTAGFIVYITVRGELPAYLCVVGIGTGCPTPPSTVVSSGSNSSVTNNTTNTANNNPGITTTQITSPPIGGTTGGNVTSTTNGYPIFTSTFGNPSEGGIGSYSGTLGSGYQYPGDTNQGGDNGTDTGGDDGYGDYE